MRYILRTAGEMAKMFYAYGKANGHECLAFADNNHGLWGSTIDNIPVESLLKSFSRYQKDNDIKIIVVLDASVKIIRDICRDLAGTGFDASDILIVDVDFVRGDSAVPHMVSYEHYNSLEYLEFHVTHRCNLNCAGCSHFVPLIPTNVEVDNDKLKKDILRLKELVHHIENIRIMGGEPLLNKSLNEYCALTRKHFPYANIRVVSNGILATKMPQKLIAVMNDNNISMDITCYPPYYDKYESVAKWLDEQSIKYHMDIRWGLCPILHKDARHKFRHDNTSLICECYNLFDGHLYPCPPTAYIKFFNDFFGENFPADEGVNIYQCDSFEMLWENIIAKKKLCDFCNHYFMTKHYERRPFAMSKHPPLKEDYIRDYHEHP